MSTDAQQWRRVAFPEPVDLTAVKADDARTATVISADGRTSRTSDGGLTWGAVLSARILSGSVQEDSDPIGHLTLQASTLDEGARAVIPRVFERSRSMSARFWLVTLALVAGTYIARSDGPVAAAAPAAAQDATTLDDQVELAVTVYNSDIALVRDVRTPDASRAASPISGSWTSPRR